MFMKNKIGIWLVVLLSCCLLLVACGERSQESVTKTLEDSIASMKGFKAKAEMIMNTGQEEQTYEVDIWHKKSDFYRVELNSAHAEYGSQIILKNEDGVFVLTPALNKNFKFQTEWPDNSSQPYLYQSLVNDITRDDEATFEVTDNHYIFRTKTNYQNSHHLPSQEIYFDKKSMAPVLVKVLDTDQNASVEVRFTHFELDPSFQENDFLVEENLALESKETMSHEASEADVDPFEVLFPLYTAGAELDERKEVALDDGERIIMTFSGENHFTLIQEKFDTVPTLSFPKEIQGDIVNLGFTLGALSDHTLQWSYNGVEFYLASEDLSRDELIAVAQSVQGQEVK